MHEGEARFLRRKRLNRALAEGVRRLSAALQCGHSTPHTNARPRDGPESLAVNHGRQSDIPVRFRGRVNKGPNSRNQPAARALTLLGG